MPICGILRVIVHLGQPGVDFAVRACWGSTKRQVIPLGAIALEYHTIRVIAWYFWQLCVVIRPVCILGTYVGDVIAWSGWFVIYVSVKMLLS